MQNPTTHTDERQKKILYDTFLTGRTVKGQFTANGCEVFVA